MTDKNPDVLEQNKRINEISRRVGRLEPKMKTLENAIEPGGYISQAFEKIEEHLDEQDQKIGRLELKINSLEQTMNYNFAELRSSLSHIIDHLTKLSDLPEE